MGVPLSHRARAALSRLWHFLFPSSRLVPLPEAEPGHSEPYRAADASNLTHAAQICSSLMRLRIQRALFIRADRPPPLPRMGRPSGVCASGDDMCRKGGLLAPS